MCCINDDTIQKRLLAKLMYAKGPRVGAGPGDSRAKCERVSCKEMASPYMPTRNGQQEVHKVTPERKAELSCYRCGKAGHVASKH